ncbi:MAG: DUF6883 domain-containing protein [Bacteroidota bacterium]
MNLLPNHANANIDISKLKDYCLNENHPIGKFKARVFLSALSISSKNADFLKSEILKGLHLYNSIETSSTRYGKRYLVDMIILNFDNTKKADVRTVWIIPNDDENPKLISCYVKNIL